MKRELNGAWEAYSVASVIEKEMERRKPFREGFKGKMKAMRETRDLMQNLEDDGQDRDPATGERSAAWKNLYWERERIRGSIGFRKSDYPTADSINCWLLTFAPHEEGITREQLELSLYGLHHCMALALAKGVARGKNPQSYLQGVVDLKSRMSGSSRHQAFQELLEAADIALTRSETLELGQRALQYQLRQTGKGAPRANPS